ncbi:TIGR02444 family protein [Pseudomonas sp. Fl5BN2]|uniref:TIGR02444 family protein n=1 Tax=unclassified Pseudomonas TaxID=196821 RepID=UPI0013773A9D|nr:MULTISPECIES: TIGR02444 family protein [unclassified Pseudomonas]NBF01050.1 TIGR02444 family protein [Pseudomonas sp. Fl5BN2]NBF07721.1 TIGR02444 family protein [Pseudomonas sp. Fl4BN1]
MSSDLWSFALKTYALPGVQEACLQLQDGGADVCLLLCAAWLGQRGVGCDEQRLKQLEELAAPWQRDVVQPLRTLRIEWRAAATEDADLGALREQLKTLELQAERQLLMRLQKQARDWPGAQANSLEDWLEGLAAEAADLNRDALQVLCVAVTGA